MFTDDGQGLPKVSEGDKNHFLENVVVKKFRENPFFVRGLRIVVKEGNS